MTRDVLFIAFLGAACLLGATGCVVCETHGKRAAYAGLLAVAAGVIGFLAGVGYRP